MSDFNFDHLKPKPGVIFSFQSKSVKNTGELIMSVREKYNLTPTDYTHEFERIYVTLMHNIKTNHNVIVKRSKEDGNILFFVKTSDLPKKPTAEDLIIETARLLRAFKPMPKDVDLLKLADDLEKIKAAE